MLKRLFKLFLAVIPFVPVIDPGIEAHSFSRVNEVTVAPFSFSGDSLIEISITANKFSPVTIEMYVINDMYSDGVLIYENFYVISKNDVIKYNNAYTRDKNYLKIVAFINNEETVVFNEFIPRSSSNYIVISGEDEIYESDSTFINLDNENESLLNKREQIRFINFTDFYVPNFYHKIDLSNFKLESLSKNALNAKSIRLIISNPNGNFGLFDDGKTSVTFPLEFEKNGNIYSLKFKDLMYVDKNTLEMSPTMKSDYVATKYLFLPRDEMRNQEDYSCVILFEGFGIDKDTVLFSFNLKAIINTFGDCHNSEYCIVRKN